MFIKHQNGGESVISVTVHRMVAGAKLAGSSVLEIRYVFTWAHKNLWSLALKINMELVSIKMSPSFSDQVGNFLVNQIFVKIHKIIDFIFTLW